MGLSRPNPNPNPNPNPDPDPDPNPDPNQVGLSRRRELYFKEMTFDSNRDPNSNPTLTLTTLRR